MAPRALPAGLLVLVAVLFAGCGTRDCFGDCGIPTFPNDNPAPASPSSTSAIGSTPPRSPAASDPAVAVPRSGTWARVEVDGPAPAPREDHTWTLAEDGRTAYLFGGHDGAAVFDDLWSFDLATDRWRRLAINGPAPAARFGHEAALLPDGSIAIWAGQAGAEFFDDAWLLDPGARSWRLLDARGDVPVARYGSCSGVGPDGRLWVSHGFTANGVRFDDTTTLDLGAERWRAVTTPGAKPIERCLHACWWTSDGRLALYGGQTNGVPALGDLWFLSPDAGGNAATWSETAGQEAPARQLAAIARRDAVTFIFGGRDADRAPLSDTWTVADGSTVLRRLQAPNPPPARSGAAMINDPTGDRLVLFGGLGDAAFGDAWEMTFR